MSWDSAKLQCRADIFHLNTFAKICICKPALASEFKQSLQKCTRGIHLPITQESLTPVFCSMFFNFSLWPVKRNGLLQLIRADEWNRGEHLQRSIISSLKTGWFDFFLGFWLPGRHHAFPICPSVIQLGAYISPSQMQHNNFIKLSNS